jgi:hypothetical protein
VQSDRQLATHEIVEEIGIPCIKYQDVLKKIWKCSCKNENVASGKFTMTNGFSHSFQYLQQFLIKEYAQVR